MKKLFSVILLMILPIIAYSKETVTIYWGWGIGDSLAKVSKTLAHEANQIQDKYLFIFDARPGAGGAIAASLVQRTPNSILATSSAFFVRPSLYPTTNPYRIKDFKELMPQCYSPIVITSSKYQSWKDVPFDKTLSISVAGMGSTTHLTSIQLKSRLQNLIFVPYKGVAEGFAGMLAGEVDFDAGFLGSIEGWDNSKSSRKVNVLGLTGSNRTFGYPLLIDQGFPEIFASINLPLHLVVPVSTPAHKYQEWREILFKAAKTESVRASYRFNHCIPLDNMPTQDIQPWFDSQVGHWKRLSQGINLEN